MTARRVHAVIPARFASTRFPGKPLTPILGTPMIAHVVARCREAACFDDVVMATDDDRIAAVAAAAGARVAMTGEARSGTDRVAIAVRDVDATVVLNVQRDRNFLSVPCCTGWPEVLPRSLRSRGESVRRGQEGGGCVLRSHREQDSEARAVAPRSGQAAALPASGGGGGLSMALASRWRRIFLITSGSVMNAMIRMPAPQRGQRSGSTS